MQVEQISHNELRTITSGLADFPFEQSGAYVDFSTTQGHPLVLCTRWYKGNKTIAVAAFFRYEIRSVPFLWARHGPIWFSASDPSQEEEMRKCLKTFMNNQKNPYAFVRLDQTYIHAELFTPPGLVTYDRTVIIDGAGGDQTLALEKLPKSGKRMLTKARKQLDELQWEIRREELVTPEDFQPFYSILEETAQRDGFSAHPRDYYWDLCQSKDPNEGSYGCRLYSLHIEGQPVCWDLVALNKTSASLLYGASSEEGREVGAPSILDFQLSCLLAEEGFLTSDMMGIHSPLTPELYSVGRYKLKFAQTYTDVPRSWDYPLKPAIYRALRGAYSLRSKLMSIKS